MSMEVHVPVEIVSAEESEARAATEQIRTGLSDLWEGLARMVAINGWELLGYSSFRRWAADELGMSLSKANEHLRKTKRLIEMSAVMNKTIAELAPQVSLRSGHRRTIANPIAAAMLTSSRKLASIPHLANPDERNAAIELRHHLNRLLGES